MENTTPKIIVAGAGMSHGGRIRAHEKKYLPDPQTTLLIVGYQVPGSLGRRLQDGARKVEIDGEWVTVRAKIFSTSGFSAHAELVIFTQNASSLTTANAAKAIGSAMSDYAKGDTALFALHSGSTTGVYLFTSGGGDATVSAAELVQVATLTGVPAVSAADFGLAA